jgi:hypothetical protein
MALMLAKLYTALREAGADDDKAREAARRWHRSRTVWQMSRPV